MSQSDSDGRFVDGGKHTFSWPAVERQELRVGNLVRTLDIEHPSGTYAIHLSIAAVDPGMLREAIAAVDLWLADAGPEEDDPR